VPVAAVAVKVALCKPGVDDEIVHVDVVVPLAVSEAEVHVIVRPVPTPATLTVPAKFWVLVNVNTSVVDAPELKLTSTDAADTTKSPTWTVIVVELVTVGLPPDPVRATE